MKLFTKRLFAVALTLAMTLGMAMNAMALDGVSDAMLQSAGIDPAKAEWITDWKEIKPQDALNPSKESGKGYAYRGVDSNGNVVYTVDFHEFESSKYVKYAIVHNKAGQNQEIYRGSKIIVRSLSPFRLVGERKDGAAASSTSSTTAKSPKTGMHTGWMLWLVAAGVLAGSAAVLYKRERD